jgi:hypothetical protein
MVLAPRAPAAAIRSSKRVTARSPAKIAPPSAKAWLVGPGSATRARSSPEGRS